jgi:hypothetical protein
MSMRTVVVALVAVAAIAQAAAARADCLSDCQDAYQAATAACQDRYGGAGQEVQLQQCMDDAQESFGACNDRCETLD